jgi:hypothetical protein
MSGLSRRDLLKGAAVATGAAWASPVLFSGTAWAHPGGADEHGGTSAGTACACGDGVVVYAKFAPGNSQTCQNQCLQPGLEVLRLPWDCLENNGIVSVCDQVKSNSDTASLNFLKGTRPMRVAIKSEGSCYAVRCSEGFHTVYKWTTSDNVELFDNAHVYADTQADPENGMFRVYSSGASVPGPCTGASQGGPIIPSGTHVGGSASSDHAYYGLVTGIALNTSAVSSTNDKLNFIEFELCIPNASTLPCKRTDCVN